MRILLTAALFLSLLTSCDRIEIPPPPTGAPSLAGHDYGEIDHFNGCEITPPQVSPSDACLIDKLRANCTKGADCMLTCMGSPDGPKASGGCDEVCFGSGGAQPESERPVAEIRLCRSRGGGGV